MRTVRIILNDAEEKELTHLKGNKTWKELLTHSLPSGDGDPIFNGGQKVGRIENVETGRRSDQTDKQRRAGDTGDIKHQERSGESEHNHKGDHAVGQSTASEGSAGAPGSKRINFVGGKKSMGKKEESGAKEEDEYQCYNCDHIQGSPFTDCPKCGASNSFDE